MSDKTRIQALEQFGRQLDAVVPEQQRRGRARRVVLLVGGATALIAAPAVAVTDPFDFGGNTPRPGQPGGAPLPVTTPGVRSINVLEVLLGPDGQRRLRQAVAPYGLRVKVHGRPVTAAAVGRVFGVQYPRSARFDARQHLVLEKGSRGTILVTVGRAAAAGEQVGTAGLSLFEVLPRVEAAVRRDDPTGTLERLRGQGFDVLVKLVIGNPDKGAPSATGVKIVSVPPAGSVVLAVTNASGQNRATERTNNLILEVAPASSDVAGSHP